jgi:GDP-4-dehydro-6-deoxy-D-mannose reductase
MTELSPLPGPVLITGAGGFVGRHVIAALAAASPQTEIIRSSADITDAGAVRTLIESARPATCLHLAAIAAIGVARAEPDRAWAVNLHGTLNLAAAIRDLAPACRLIFVSSADIYGASFRSGEPLDEQALLAPLNTYGATKAAADLALGAMAAAENLNVLRLRAFNHTGPGQSEHFAVPAFARQIALAEAGLAEPVIRVGALTPERDFLDVRDVAQAYTAAIANGAALPSGTILNIASGMPRKIGDALAALLALAKIEVRVEEEQARLRPSDIPRAIGNATQAHRLLNWHPTIPWQQTIADTLHDWRTRVRST